MRRRIDLAIVIAVAATTHFLYFYLRYGSFYFPDSFTYLEPAKSLLHGLGFVSGTPSEIETIRTPGYPLLLALFGARTIPVIVLQHLISVAVAVAIYLLVERRVRSRFAALTAAILFAIDPPTLLVTNKLLTEGIFTALLFVAFLLALRDRPPWLAIAVVLGCLAMVRPIAMFFFIFAMFRFPRRVWLPFALASIALPVAWAARNRHHTGVFTVSSIGSINMLGQRAAGALAIEDEGDFRADLLDEEQGLSEDADDFIQQKLHIPDAEELPTAVRAKYYGSFATKIIAAHKLAFVELTVRGLLVNIFDSDWEAIEVVSRLHPSVVKLTLDAFTALEFFLAVGGVIALWRTDRLLAVAIVVSAGYFLVISAGGEAEARFRVPVMPELAIAAGLGLARGVRRAPDAASS